MSNALICVWSVCSPVLQLQLSLVWAPCPRDKQIHPAAGTGQSWKQHHVCHGLKMLSFSRACAWRLCNGFPENTKMHTHTGAHLNGSRQSTSAKNLSGLLTSYSSQLPVKRLKQRKQCLSQQRVLGMATWQTPKNTHTKTCIRNPYKERDTGGTPETFDFSDGKAISHKRFRFN